MVLFPWKKKKKTKTVFTISYSREANTYPGTLRGKVNKRIKFRIESGVEQGLLDMMAKHGP